MRALATELRGVLEGAFGLKPTHEIEVYQRVLRELDRVESLSHDKYMTLDYKSAAELVREALALPRPSEEMEAFKAEGEELAALLEENHRLAKQMVDNVFKVFPKMQKLLKLGEEQLRFLKQHG